MNQEAIDRLTRALKRIIPHPIGLIEDSGNPRQIGQFYQTIPEPTFPADLPKDCKTDDPVCVVIISSHHMPIIEHSLHLVAPVITNTPMAGPEDVILPREILPYRPAIAMGHCFSILDQSLGKCMGRLTDETTNNIINFREFIHGDIDTCPKVVTGPDYLDEMDIRYKFHQEILDKATYLTVPVLQYIKKIWGPQLRIKRNEFDSTCIHCNSNNCEPLESNEWECYDCGETFTPKDSKKIS
jgi:hypothetical protein